MNGKSIKKIKKLYLLPAEMENIQLKNIDFSNIDLTNALITVEVEE